MATWHFPHLIRALATSPDGRLMVTGCQDGRMRVAVISPYQELCETERLEWIYTLAVCAIGDADRDDLLVVTGHDRWMVRCWRVDVTARQLRLEWTGRGAREGAVMGYDCDIRSVCISHNCKWAAVGGQNVRSPHDADDDICLFSLLTDDDDGGASLRRPARVFVGHTYPPNALCFSPDDRFLVSGGSDKTLRVWSVESGEQLQCLKLDSLLWCMALRQQGAVELFTGHNDGSVRLWPLDQNMNVGGSAHLFGGAGSVDSIYCAENGKHVVFGRDKDVWMGNLAGRVTKLEGHTRLVSGVSVTSTGNVVSGSYDNTVRLWRLDDPDVRRAIAPLCTLLEKERVALKRVRDACASSSPLTTVVLTIIIIQNERRQRQIRMT